MRAWCYEGRWGRERGRGCGDAGRDVGTEEGGGTRSKAGGGAARSKSSGEGVGAAEVDGDASGGMDSVTWARVLARRRGRGLWHGNAGGGGEGEGAGGVGAATRPRGVVQRQRMTENRYGLTA